MRKITIVGGQTINLTDDQMKRVQAIVDEKAYPEVVMAKCGGWYNRLRVQLTEEIRENLKEAMEKPVGTPIVFILDQSLAVISPVGFERDYADPIGMYNGEKL